MATSTPWGAAQTTQHITRGIVSYSTASHGGYHVSKTLNQQIPDYFRDTEGWYEEDCDWAIVVLFFPAHFEPKHYVAAVQSLQQWHPHQWQRFIGEPIAKAEKCWDCNKGNCSMYVKEAA